MSAIYFEFLPLHSSIEFKTIQVYDRSCPTVTSLPKKIQQVLSHGSQLGGKKTQFFSMQEHFCGWLGMTSRKLQD